MNKKKNEKNENKKRDQKIKMNQLLAHTLLHIPLFGILNLEINSCDKKLILMTKNPFLSQEISSCHKISILVTRNHLL